MEAPQCILILDFGGQYTQLIARRVRERRVYSCVLPCSAQLADIRPSSPWASFSAEDLPACWMRGAPGGRQGVFDLGVPVLGICYGMRLMAHLLDAPVEEHAPRIRAHRCDHGPGRRRPAGRAPAPEPLLDEPYLSGGAPAGGFMAIAHTADCPVAAMADDAHRLYGVQFHPEVTHTEEGARVLENFLFGICGCKATGAWTRMRTWRLEQIREQVGDGTVLLGLSGGWTARWRRRCSTGPSVTA